MQLHHRLVSILRRVRQDVATLLDKEAINAACREENYFWKNRLLNPANTVHLFIIPILNENTPLNDLPHKSGESFTGSALTAQTDAGASRRGVKERTLNQRHDE